MRELILFIAGALVACGAAPTEPTTDVRAESSSDGAPVLRETELTELPRDEPEAMPVGVSRWAVASGWGGTHFVAHADDNRITVIQGGAASDFAVGEAVVEPRALLVDGGRLIAATRDGLLAFDLRTTEHTIVAEVAGITSLALDHVGYYIASVSDGPPLRVTPDGHVSTLDGAASGPVAFDPSRRELHVVDEERGRALVYDYVRLVGEDPAVWAARDARPMRPFVIGDLGLTSAEYWPNRGDEPTSYPNDVLWGFYPEEGVVFEGVASPVSATPAAVACAEQSYAALRSWLADAPEEMHRAVALGTSNRFYLWVNDYSEASDPFPHEMRPNRFWYWSRDPPVVGRIPGYWKWETTLTQSGECRIPDPAQAAEYLADKLAELAAAS